MVPLLHNIFIGWDVGVDLVDMCDVALAQHIYPYPLKPACHGSCTTSYKGKYHLDYLLVDHDLS